MVGRRSVLAALVLGLVCASAGCAGVPEAIPEQQPPPLVSADPAAATPGAAGAPVPPPATTPEQPVSRWVVVLDPGHNGGNASAPEEVNRPVPAGGFWKPCNTTGTETDSGYAEHAFAFDVSRRAATVLRSAGVTVLLTRTDDLGVGPCVDARAAAANEVDADVTVSVHADGAAVGARGFHVIEPDVAPDGGNADILPASHEAAAMLRTAFAAATGATPATYPGGLVEPGLTRRNDLAGLNLTRVPAVFIECANMRDPDDAAAVTDPDWRQSAAQGIADGVLSFLGSR
jgi:N-acetylmuramoyl-L-alanine amidase